MKLYLDIDGAVSPLGDGTPPTWPDWTQNPNESFPMLLSVSMAKALASLPVDLVYLTTWGKEANTSISPNIGLPDLQVMPRVAGTTWWKLAAIQQVSQPFIWIDDEIEWYGNLSPTGDLSDMFPGSLLIAPDKYTGITPEHIQEIRAYLHSAS